MKVTRIGVTFLKLNNKLWKKVRENNDTSNNSMDVRAKQRLCLVSCPLNSELRGGGFTPRHLRRSAAKLCINNTMPCLLN